MLNMLCATAVPRSDRLWSTHQPNRRPTTATNGVRSPRSPAACVHVHPARSHMVWPHAPRFRAAAHTEHTRVETASALSQRWPPADGVSAWQIVRHHPRLLVRTDYTAQTVEDFGGGIGALGASSVSKVW